MLRYLAAGVAFLGVVFTVDAEPWARFRGPNGEGVSHEKNIPVEFGKEKNVLWKAEVGLGGASPVIWGSNVFIHASAADGSKRFLKCLDAATGREKWSNTFPGAKAHIHKKNSWAAATPATDGEAVYVPFWDGVNVHMTAFDMAGQQLWTRNLGIFISQHGPGASPVVYKDKVYLANDMDKEDPKTKVAVNNPSILYAFNKRTGDTAWELPREAYRACYSAPFVIESPGKSAELIVTSTTSVTSYDPDSGKSNWAFNEKFINRKGNFPLRTISSTLLFGDTFLSCAGDGGGDRHAMAISLTGPGGSPKKLWENRKEFPYVPSLLRQGDHVYFVNDTGFAGCFEIKTGKQVWYERLPGATFTSSPILIDGKVYAPSEEGDVFVFAARPTFELFARNNLGGVIRSTPSVADGKLYIRTEKTLYCIGAK